MLTVVFSSDRQNKLHKNKALNITDTIFPTVTERARYTAATVSLLDFLPLTKYILELQRLQMVSKILTLTPNKDLTELQNREVIL